MPTPQFILDLRAKVGQELLWLSTAMGAVFDDEGRVLLGRRADIGVWTLPGGIIDVGVRDPSPPCKDGEPRHGTVTDTTPGGACGIHGLAQADLIDARALIEGPIGKGWSFGQPL